MGWKVAAVVLATALAGCTTPGGGDSRPSAQAFAGSPAEKPLATSIVNAMAGGLIGRSLGTGIDASERRRALEAEYRALEYMPAGEGVNWGRAGESPHGEVVAGSPYRVGSQDCRQYTHTIHVDGQSRTARGAACRNGDGSWTPLV